MLKELATPDAVIVDAGNSLFVGGEADDAATRARAGLILQTLGALGTKVLAVGPRDLSLGLEWLGGQAKRAGVQLLSCNLERPDGQLAFAGSTVLTAGGLRVAFVGLTGTTLQAPHGLVVRPAKPALEAELAKLPAHELTVVLTTASYAEAAGLGAELAGKVDFLIEASEPRGTPPAQPLQGGALLLASGQKGQQVGALTLDVGGKGAFADLDEAQRNQERLTFLDGQLQTLETRLKAATDPTAKAQLEGTMKELRSRRAEQQAQVSRATSPTGRRFRLAYRTLDPSVKDDEALKAEVLKVDPAYSGSH